MFETSLLSYSQCYSSVCFLFATIITIDVAAIFEIQVNHFAYNHYTARIHTLNITLISLLLLFTIDTVYRILVCLYCIMYVYRVCFAIELRIVFYKMLICFISSV